jgi:hypothetical protein
LCLRGPRFLAQPLPSHAAHAAHATCPRSALAAAADALLHAKQPTAADWGSLSMATARSAHALPRCRLGGWGTRAATYCSPVPINNHCEPWVSPIRPSVPPSIHESARLLLASRQPVDIGTMLDSASPPSELHPSPHVTVSVIRLMQIDCHAPHAIVVVVVAAHSRFLPCSNCCHCCCWG